MIKIISYQATWPGEFQALGGVLHQALGDLALRIDHIGSTSVPGLAAKDLIDIQITVQSLDPAVERELNRAGYQRAGEFSQDHIPPGDLGKAADWTKWYFDPPPNQRPTHVHVRVAGRANQRYALLFRDYLRANPASAQAYAQVKRALAKLHPNDAEAYYDVKDPVCDIIMGGAEAWAAANHWQPGPSDC